jgi:hypothetical protein
LQQAVSTIVVLKNGLDIIIPFGWETENQTEKGLFGAF